MDSTTVHYNGVCEIENGYIVVGSIELDDTTTTTLKSDGLICMYDGSGKLVWKKQHDKYHFESYNRCIAYNEFIYAFGLKHNNDVLEQQRMVVKLDLSGNIISTTLIGDTTQAWSGNRTESILQLDDGFIVSGNNFFDITSGNAGDIVKVDYNGNVQWQRFFQYTDTEMTNDWVSHVVDDGTGLVLLLHTQKPIDPYPNWTQTIIKTDYDGNEIWRKDFSNFQVPSNIKVENTGVRTFHIVPYNQGSLVLMKALDIWGRVKRTYLLEIDANGNEKGIHDSMDGRDYRSFNFVKTQDGGVAAIGNSWFNDPGASPKHLIVKWSETLKFQWYSENGLDGVTNWQTDGIHTSDGGYLIPGYVLIPEIGNSRFGGILTKTDCKGNIVWDYESCSINQDNLDLIVFPNPSEGQFFFHFNNLANYEMKIFDYTGRLIESLTMNNTNVLVLDLFRHANGLYHYSIYVEGENKHYGKLIKR